MVLHLRRQNLTLLDGSVADSVVNGKAVIYGGSGQVAGTLVNCSTAKCNQFRNSISINSNRRFSSNWCSRYEMLATFDIDATDDIDIDTTDTTGGIAIGTANSGVPFLLVMQLQK